MLQTYKNNPKPFLHGALLILIIVAPFWFPNFTTQLATLWLFIIVAMTWDMTGGQMGYNSLGNIFFYGTCLLYTSPSPRDQRGSRMPSSA